MLNNQGVWLESVVIVDKTFWFVYDYYADINTTDLYTFGSYESATNFCAEHNLDWEYKNNAQD